MTASRLNSSVYHNMLGDSNDYIAIIKFEDELLINGEIISSDSEKRFDYEINISGRKVLPPRQCRGKKACLIENIPTADEYLVEIKYIGDTKLPFDLTIRIKAKFPFLGKVSHASICRLNTKCVLNFDEHVQGYIWIRPRRDDTCIKINPHEDYYVYAGAIAATISGRPDVDNMKFTKMLKDGYLKQAFNGPDFSTINMVLYATDKTLNKALGSSSKSSLINFGVDKMNSNIVDQFMGELKKLTTKLIDSDYHSQFVEIITTSNSVCP